jgi:hypothetical protein
MVRNERVPFIGCGPDLEEREESEEISTMYRRRHQTAGWTDKGLSFQLMRAQGCKFSYSSGSGRR